MKYCNVMNDKFVNLVILTNVINFDNFNIMIYKIDKRNIQNIDTYYVSNRDH